MRRGERRTADLPVRPPRGGTGGDPTMPSGNPWLAIGTVDESGGVTPSTGSFGVKDARSLVDGSEVDCDEADNDLTIASADGSTVLLVRDDHEDRWIGIPALNSTLCTDPCYYY